MKLFKVRNASQVDIHLRVDEDQGPRELTVASNIQTEVLADVIVHRYNCHEELTEALQLAIEWFEGSHGDPGQIGCKSLEEIKQTLAKATK